MCCLYLYSHWLGAGKVFPIQLFPEGPISHLLLPLPPSPADTEIILQAADCTRQFPCLRLQQRDSAGRYCSGQERYQAGQHSTLLSWRPRVPRGEQRLVPQPLCKVRRHQTVPFPASFRATRTAAKPNSPGTLFICFYELPKYFYEGFMKRCLYFSPILQNDGRPGQ